MDGRPERYAVWKFVRLRNLLKMDWLLGLRLVSAAISVIDAPPLAIPTRNDHCSSISSSPLPIF